MSNVIHATDASFEADVINSDVPVLVEFWAPWCGPCKSLAPILDSIATEYAGRLKVVKVDVDQNNATSAQFSVKGIPALLLFKNGKVEATKIGYLPKSQLTTFIDSNL